MQQTSSKPPNIKAPHECEARRSQERIKALPLFLCKIWDGEFFSLGERIKSKGKLRQPRLQQRYQETNVEAVSKHFIPHSSTHRLSACSACPGLFLDSEIICPCSGHVRGNMTWEPSSSLHDQNLTYKTYRCRLSLLLRWQQTVHHPCSEEFYVTILEVQHMEVCPPASFTLQTTSFELVLCKYLNTSNSNVSPHWTHSWPCCDLFLFGKPQKFVDISPFCTN